MAATSSCSSDKKDKEGFLVYSVIFESLNLDANSKIKSIDYWNSVEKPCFFKIENDRYSYVSALVDVGFGVTAWNDEMNLDKARAFDLIKYMVTHGCDLDEVHPYTGHSAAHSAAFFTKKNPDLAWYIFKNSTNLNYKTLANDKHFPNMNAKEILYEISYKRNDQELRKRMYEYLNEKTHNK